MRLSEREFKAMNNPVRRFLQRRIEFPTFCSMGLDAAGKDVLEIGCGSGYGAVLLGSQGPRSYVGIDLMPEQIALARAADLPGCEFRVMDATDLGAFADASVDLVVIFGILHHIPGWQRVIAESRRVLRPGGEMFIEEPSETVLWPWDRVFKWGHPPDARFGLAALERELGQQGFEVKARRRRHLFGYYRAATRGS